MDRKVMVPDILKRKGGSNPIVALTAYDFPFGRIVDEAGVDVILSVRTTVSCAGSVS